MKALSLPYAHAYDSYDNKFNAASLSLSSAVDMENHPAVVRVFM